MNLQPGMMIQATPLLDDTVFQQALVLLVEYNAQGALGFILERPFGRCLNELVEFRHSPPFPIFDGGPVDQEHLFFIHRRPDQISEGVPVGKDLYWGGNFGEAVRGINNGSLSTGDLVIFAGYCGWDQGDLEGELEEGSWTLETAGNTDPFKPGN